MNAMDLGLTVTSIGGAALVLLVTILTQLDRDAWHARQDAELRRLTAPIPELPVGDQGDDGPGFPATLCPSGRHRAGVAPGSSAQRERWTCVTGELELLCGTEARA